MKTIHKMATLIVALVMTLALVACGGSSAGESAQSAADSNASTTDATEDVTTPGENATSLASGTNAEIGSLPTLSAKLPTGSLVSFDALEEPDQLTESETEEVNRAIRAYKAPEEESLLINNAKSFYYHDQLEGDAKSLYEALLQLYSDPTNDSAFFAVQLKKDQNAQEFEKSIMLAYLAIQYDHPEFFWSYNGLETDVNVAQPFGSSSSYIFSLDKPYKRYEKEMKAFNEATEEFLSDIDRSGSDYQIAQAIHDKLIRTATYDFDVAEANEANDLAHTAYGALVENSSGDKNTAVCDGYAQAYVYLLQQCGINATVVVGNAGEDTSSMGGHAWAVVQLDGEWYEVDSTWDDQDQWQDALAEAREADPENAALPYYEEALGDETYLNKISHYMYNVTTDAITNYQPTDEYTYTFDDGAKLQLVSSSVHQRFTEDEDAFFGSLVELAPEATGTKYAFDAS